MSSLFGSLNNPTPKPSLFSATPSTGAPTSSGGLFSGLNASSTGTTGTPGTGLGLGGLGQSTQQSQQPQAGALGGLGASNVPTGGGGLFPSLGGNRLGGGLGGQQAQTTPSIGLSGTTLGVAGTLGQSQQPASSLGAFGSATEPRNGSSLFGQSQNPLQQSQRNGTGQSGAYFDAILEKSRKRVHAESSQDDLPALQLGLGDLRQRMKKLGGGPQDGTVDGKAHYLLAASGVDPGAAMRDLNMLNAQAGRAPASKPQEIVDTDLEGYLANLQTKTTLNMIADGLARSVRDFDMFLDENVSMEWDAQRKRIYQHFGIRAKDPDSIVGKGSFANSTSDSQAGFGRSRRSKGAALAGSRTSGVGASTFGRSNLQKSVIGSTGPVGRGHQPLFTESDKREGNADGIIQIDRVQRDKQARFAEKVMNLNLSRLGKQSFPVFHEFSNAILQGGEDQSADFLRAYKALVEIVGESSEVMSLRDPTLIKERQFAKAYLDETQKSDVKLKINTMILKGSASYLEKEFYEQLEALIIKNPREANLGGIPNVISKVKAYLRIRAARKDLVTSDIELQMLNGDYVWALIFYLLRSGHIKDAVQYVEENAVAFRAIDRNFASYISRFASSPDQRLPRDLQDRMNNEYNQRLRIAPADSIDPFRMACYKVVGRCDLANRSFENLNQGVEDFIWLQFTLAREVNRVDEIANEVLGLAEVQAVIKNVGGRFFGKGTGENGGAFGMYFFLLILGGCFEEAIDYLHGFAPIDAVHFAIALDFYGLLRVSDPATGNESLMSFTTKQSPQISFGYFIGYYTRDFRAAHSAAAVDYLTLICLNEDLPGDAGRNQARLCHEALRELVLESREFALLLGDLRQDGQRVKGLIEERLRLIGMVDSDDFMRTVTIQAASIADDNGRTNDAVLLYHLAGEYDNVITIISRAISEAIATPADQDAPPLQRLKPNASQEAQTGGGTLSLSSIDEPVELATYMIGFYQSNRMYLDKIKPETQNACKILMQISTAKTQFQAGQWTATLDTISTLSILPLSAHGNGAEIRRYATIFSSLPQLIASTVPNLLLWTIQCCNRQRVHLTSGQFGGNDGTRHEMIQDLKQQNLDLTAYTSQLRYRFPAYLHEAMARAQSE